MRVNRIVNIKSRILQFLIWSVTCWVQPPWWILPGKGTSNLVHWSLQQPVWGLIRWKRHLLVHLLSENIFDKVQGAIGVHKQKALFAHVSPDPNGILSGNEHETQSTMWLSLILGLRLHISIRARFVGFSWKIYSRERSWHCPECDCWIKFQRLVWLRHLQRRNLSFFGECRFLPDNFCCTSGQL